MKRFFVIDHTFLKKALGFISGASIAQLLPVLMMPVLARLYTPDAFGIFAIYVAVVTLLSTVSTGRYELALLQPKTFDGVFLLCFGAVCLVIAFSLLLSLFFLAVGCVWPYIGSFPVSIWFALPVFLTGLSFLGINIAMREACFHEVTVYRIFQAFCLIALQFLLFYFLPNAFGLIVGHIGALVLAVFFLGYRLWRRFKSQCFVPSIGDAIFWLKRYWRYPFFSVPGALLDALALQIPLFFLVWVYGAADAGYFSLAFRMLNLPAALFSMAIGQLFFQAITKAYHEDREKLTGYVVKVFSGLLLVITPFVGFIHFFGAPLFVMVFGATWAPAGDLLGLLVFAMAVRFIVSPLSGVLAMHHTIRMGVFWQALYCVTLTLTLLIASQYPLRTLILCYVVHEVMLYGLYFLLILKGASAPYFIQVAG